jgi:hypothetical protein
MPSQKYSLITSYENAENYLGKKLKRISDFQNKNVRIVRENDNSIVVTLHGNIIVRFAKGKPVSYPYDGQWKNSPTTKRILKSFGKV